MADSKIVIPHEKRLPYVKRPCKDCPYRKDTLKGWFGAERAIEFVKTGSFVCHKNHKLQCAGHMILRGNDNDFLRLAKRMGRKIELEGNDDVFDNVEDFINHHDHGSL